MSWTPGDSKNISILTLTNMYPTRRRPFVGTFVRSHQEEFLRLGIPNDLVADRGESGGRLAILGKYVSLFVRSVWAALRRRHHVVHAHYVFPTGFIAWIAAALRGSALVVTSHRGDIWDMPRRSRVHHWFTKKVLERSDHVVAVNEKLKDEMVGAFRIDPHKISIIDMGVTTAEFEVADKRAEKEGLGLPRERLLILFVGVGFERKGAGVLLDAVARLGEGWREDAHLYLIGGDDLTPYRRRIDEAGLGDRVTLLGLRPHEETRRWVRAADVFVLPSYSEGLPVSVMEAMAAGCAIVCTDVGGIPHLIERGRQGLLVSPGSDEELAEALVTVMRDEAIRRSVAAAGHARIQAYDTSCKVREILSVYRRVLERSQPLSTESR
jgi:glycosyltransferase involved in cell wall biosynthesis